MNGYIRRGPKVNDVRPEKIGRLPSDKEKPSRKTANPFNCDVIAALSILPSFFFWGGELQMISKRRRSVNWGGSDVETKGNKTF